MSEICTLCGLPKELCACEQIAKERQEIKIYTVERRYQKKVTIIEGIEDMDLNEIAKKLKTRCASGGTVKNNTIELQGDHKKKVQEALQEMGLSAKIK
ncbi:MAG: translation initiation factor [Candidatus Thermoplasmatota archaeon]|nr:translation initiation factor [Candidatus Thermoplasmatota archaeon]MDI6887530.1 translation initiation factor [Candidatus Thermoplasmatota archaeon]